MDTDDIRWNDQAREKILSDADRVLREAVVNLAAQTSGASSDEVFEMLNAAIKDQFIDYEPGPDIRKYVDAIANGEIHE